ncbi:SixA phosphatase family protein [Sphingomicrobium lutaoense]|uniref:Phosphohistidine phosphatase n=1 Tax=Sphingomicrobium lutaoense TaxID=515949 RepID=A0A839YXH5_9SPHN|nr:histidine phosphatase family protein [Sphingomicrobium lutaoense]MBB3763018.1 phosphohistidine phosphatase [Sphingomicrobium lutaoense]
MPELLILRHAKSDWGDDSLSDFDRPLNKRGRRDAPRMGKVIAQIGAPDLILASPARRVVETLEGVAENCEIPPPRYLRQLYGAATADLVTILREIAPGTPRAMIAGHNPGLHWLAMSLTRDDPSATVLAAKYPTAALAHISFEGDWDRLGESRGRLLQFTRPRDL